MKNSYEPSLYRMLCVDKTSTDETIKKSYKGLLMQHHPDKNQGNETIEREAHNKTLELKYAFDILSNPAARAQYDILLNKYEADKIKAEAAKKTASEIDFSNVGKRVVVKPVKLSPEQEALSVLLKGMKDVFDELRKYNEEQKRR